MGQIEGQREGKSVWRTKLGVLAKKPTEGIASIVFGVVLLILAVYCLIVVLVVGLILLLISGFLLLLGLHFLAGTYVALCPYCEKRVDVPAWKRKHVCPSCKMGIRRSGNYLEYHTIYNAIAPGTGKDGWDDEDGSDGKKDGKKAK
jgi:hypothetical protein